MVVRIFFSFSSGARWPGFYERRREFLAVVRRGDFGNKFHLGVRESAIYRVMK